MRNHRINHTRKHSSIVSRKKKRGLHSNPGLYLTVSLSASFAVQHPSSIIYHPPSLLPLPPSPLQSPIPNPRPPPPQQPRQDYRFRV